MASRATVQSPRAYDQQNLTAAVLAARVFERTAAEAGAAVVPANTRIDANLPFIPLVRYGLSSAASAATNLAALQAAREVARFLGGGVLVAPPGTFAMDATFTVDLDRCYIRGQGRGVTYWNFNPAAGGVLFHFKKPAGGEINQVGVVGCSFTSANTQNKTAILLEGARGSKVEDIGSTLTSWQGAGSIGLHTKGWDTLQASRLQILCARPILIDVNPYHASIHCDHFRFCDLECGSTLAAGKVIEIANGVNISNLTFDGYQAWLLGKYGLYWNDTNSTISSYALQISGLRSEQAQDATGHSIYLATANQSLQDISIRCAHFDNARQGVYLRGAHRVAIDDSTFPGGAGVTNLDITFNAQTSLHLRNTFLQQGSSVTLTNGRQLYEAPPPLSNMPISTTAHWVFDTGVLSTRGAYSVNGTKRISYVGQIAQGATLNLPITTANATAGYIVVNAHSPTGPIKSGGIAGFTKGSGANVLLTKWGGDATFVVAGVTTPELRLVDNGGGTLVLINVLGQAVTVVLDIVFTG